MKVTTLAGELKRVALILTIFGIGLVLSGIGIVSQDVGSCPIITIGGGCYHTFAGTNISITPTGDAIGIVGAILAASSFAIALLQRRSRVVNSNRKSPP